MIEYDCEGCGIHVYAYGRDAAPMTGFCGTCEWLCEHVPDPEEMMAIRVEHDWLNPDRPGARLPRLGQARVKAAHEPDYPAGSYMADGRNAPINTGQAGDIRAWFCRGCQVMGLLAQAERGTCWAVPMRDDCPHKHCFLPG